MNSEGAGSTWNLQIGFSGGTSPCYQEYSNSKKHGLFCVEQLGACSANAATGISWYKCNKSAAVLSSIDLSKTNLIKTNFTNANLSGASLQEANLTGANLTGANLTGANLTGANLLNADLSAAIIVGADFRGATWTDGTVCSQSSTPGVCLP